MITSNITNTRRFEAPISELDAGVSRKRRSIEWIMKGLPILALMDGLAQPAYSQALYSVRIGPMCDAKFPWEVSRQALTPSGMFIVVNMGDLRALADEDIRNRVLEAAFQENLNYCKSKNIPQSVAAVEVTAARDTNAAIDPLIIAWTSAADRRWHVIEDRVQEMIVQADAYAAAESARVAKQQALADAAAAAAAVAEKKKQAALADCGTAPKISGGPWFSSTYSVAAEDTAQHYKNAFLCVKTIKYISAAPNPFGGKAARAEFIGYSAQNYGPVSYVTDFPY